LNAYQCHVFLDWRELRSTAEEPWDRLSDDLAGRGVADLNDALLRLELRPAHEALRWLLEPALVRQLSELADTAQGAPGKQPAAEPLLEEFSRRAWQRCDDFLRKAHSFCLLHGIPVLAPEGPGPASLEARFHERLRQAMRIPELEKDFPEPWPLAARTVLPSFSPHASSVALWAPVLAWRALELLAESVDGGKPGASALELFERLHLREPMGHAFQSLGLEGEDGWRAAARLKVALLLEAGVFGKAPRGVAAVAPLRTELSQALRSPAFWQDTDVRWLIGLHEAEGHFYFVREPFEELLWWLELPRLLALTAEVQPERDAARKMNREVAEATLAAQRAGYRLDRLIAGKAAEQDEGDAEAADEATPQGEGTSDETK
jgi:hypothetical protein